MQNDSITLKIQPFFDLNTSEYCIDRSLVQNVFLQVDHHRVSHIKMQSDTIEVESIQSGFGQFIMHAFLAI